MVTGATGRTGRHVVSQLLAKNVPVRALVRDPNTAGLPPQVEVFRGDLTRPETFDRCLDGIDAVFLVWCAPVDSAAPAIERIAKRARRIVFLSSPHKTQHPLFQAARPNPISQLHEEIERLIRVSGLEWTFLRPGMFAANALWWWAPQIRAGNVVRWPYALSPSAPIDERDIAAVAVEALGESTIPQTDLVLTGPESLTHLDQVTIIGDVLGRSLRYEEIAPEDWLRDPISNMLLTAWAAAIGHPALITQTVAEITGRPSRTFRDWVKDNAAKF